MAGESISGVLAATGSPQVAAQHNEWPRADSALDYADYFRKLEENIGRLEVLWRSGGRLEALQLAVQLSRLLADTSQPKLYPKKHQLITGMLGRLGRLIQARVQESASNQPAAAAAAASSASPEPRPPLTTAANHERAREMCRNWFLKVAAIGELVPKFYIELAILSTCEPVLFAESAGAANESAKQHFYNQSLRRFLKTSWAMGDPVVALHSRLYLCQRARELLNPTLAAELVSINLLDSAKLVGYLDAASSARLGAELDQWFELICAPIESMIKLAVEQQNSSLAEPFEEKLATSGSVMELTRELLELAAKDTCSPLGRSVLATSACRGLPEDLIALEADKVTSLLRAIGESHLRTGAHSVAPTLLVLLLAPLEALAIALLASDYFETQPKLTLFKSVEPILDQLAARCSSNNGPSLHLSYLRCLKTWLSFANSYTPIETLANALHKFVRQVKMENIQLATNQQVDPIVFDIVKTLVGGRKSVSQLADLFHRVPDTWELIELFRQDNYKLACVSWCLETMKANLRLVTESIEQPQLIESILRFFATLNKCLGALADRDELERLSNLITCYLEAISIADPYKRLAFYTRCRANLANLNPALAHLSRLALRLPAEFRAQPERKRNARQDYLNGCLAFAYVTIPGVEDTCTRLNLFTEGAELAVSELSLALAHHFWDQLMGELREQIEFRVVNSARLDGGANLTDLECLQLLEKLLNVMVKHRDHIDNQHKLSLATIIGQHFPDSPTLSSAMRLLNVIKCDQSN